jgi:hypothetical protein
MDFRVFKTAVAKQFDRMQKHQLFRVAVDKDLLWETYLKSFPAGTNPVFRKRTEHDCGCCKQFIRAIGNTVALINGEVESIWDVQIPEEQAFQTVANALSAMVKSKPICDQFLHYENTAGTDKSWEKMVERVQTWNHFFVNIPKGYVMKKADIPTALSGPRSTRDVLLRSLTEITDDAVNTVLELIAQNSLYRGEEHKFAVSDFYKLKQKFNKFKTDKDREIFTWSNLKETTGSVAKIRNTSIGTLLVALSEGKELEDAVKSFEAMVAPTNYKRPTALITKAMIENAKSNLQELGLTSALERRFATINDITVNNILFADRSARKIMTGDVFDELAGSVKTTVKNLDKVEEVPIEKFINDVLPKIDSMEVMMENDHIGNLVSLIAPVDPSAGRLFKWDNGFSWSYNGGMADSIKERVKRAGGNVTGEFCCRLAWFNFDDLDFHMVEPANYEIMFSNRAHTSPCGGRLDVDMNAGGGQTREPVENIFYSSMKSMKEGVYTLNVHNFCKRESTNVGFEVEVDIKGDVYHFVHEKAVPDRQTITVAKFKYSRAGGVEILESLPNSKSVRTVWGVPTNTFQKVNVMMMSPNFWDAKAVGNKHYFFMLDGCMSDAPARGFLNEFLKEELNVHRKVFEVVGSKMMVEPSDKQLSGLGFSSTQRNSLVCRVKGKFTRIIKVMF